MFVLYQHCCKSKTEDKSDEEQNSPTSCCGQPICDLRAAHQVTCTPCPPCCPPKAASDTEAIQVTEIKDTTDNEQQEQTEEVADNKIDETEINGENVTGNRCLN